MIAWVITLFLCILLQTTLFSSLKICGVKPDLILIVVLYASLWKGVRRGVVVGFIGGMLEDIVSGGLPGANAFAKLTVGLLCGLSPKKFYLGSKRVQIMAAFFGTFLAQTIYLLISRLLGEGRTLNSFGTIIFPAALYNALLAPFVFWCIRRFFKGRYDRTKPDKTF